MKMGKVLALLALGSLAACTSASEDDEPKRRRTTSVIGDKDTDKDGTAQTGVVVVDLISTSTSQVVGNTIELTAKVYLDTAKTKPVTDGTSVSFLFSPSTNLTPTGGSAQTTGGQATLAVESSAATQFSATAKVLGATSAPVALEFTSQSNVGPAIIKISASRSSVTIADPNSNDDQATINIDVEDENKNPWQGPVKIEATDGSLSAAIINTNASGQGAVLFTASTRLGEVEVKATAGGAQASTKITVGPGAPLTIQALEVKPAQISIKGSGSVESSVATFRVVDQFGNPVSDNTLVTFSIEPKSLGATVHPQTGGLNTVAGVVAPVVKAGLRGGTVRVVAKVSTPLSPTPISASSKPITIFGGPADANRMSLSVLSEDVVQSGFSLTGLEANFTVRLTDVYGNPVMPGTSVKVYCEAGSCGANDGTGIQTTANGTATFSLFTDFSWMVWNSGVVTPLNFGAGVGTSHTWPSLGQSVDGRVNVIAVAQGRTSWDDANSNGIYDPDPVSNPNERISLFGNPDPTEPYLDINSSGTRDVAPFEIWEDFSIEGLVDAHMVNGTWDSHTPAAFHPVQSIWAAYELIWATPPELQAVPLSMVDYDSDSIFDVGTDEILLGNPDASVSSHYFGSASTTFTTVKVYFGDANRNPLPAGSKLSFEIIPSSIASEIELVDPEAEFVAGYRSAQLVNVSLIKKKPAAASGVGIPFILNMIVEVPDTALKLKMPMSGVMY